MNPVGLVSGLSLGRGTKGFLNNGIMLALNSYEIPIDVYARALFGVFDKLKGIGVVGAFRGVV